MLFARALSNGAKWFCPDIFGGGPIYTPDELGAVIDGETGQVLGPAEGMPADASSGGSTGQRESGGGLWPSEKPSPAQLKELARQVKLNQPLKPSVLAACLLSVGAKDIPAADLDSGAWATKVDKAQVSALIDLFKSGTLPTGESDVPADASEFERPADAGADEFFKPEASEA
jgi:hypothetical protein